MTDEPNDKAGEAKGGASGKEAADAKRKKQLVTTGVAVGIGSAAIVAALLYANRGRKTDKGEG